MKRGRGEERIEKGSRERRVKERKEKNKRESRRQYEEEVEYHHLLLLVVQLLQTLHYSSEDMSSRLDSAVKCYSIYGCSSEVLIRRMR